MDKVNWGIIGCGDVTELKSGPAINKIKNSALVAVMRRDAAKAKDYAERHQVSKWYIDSNLLINDPDVNVIYIATPPATHQQFTLAALAVGKPVYVEKPMALNFSEANIMALKATETNTKLVVAHYRRAQPIFKKIKQLLDEKIIGESRFVNLQYYKKALTPVALTDNRNRWRIDPEISGGGLFHDLAPHQLDLMYYFFGDAKVVNGVSLNQGNLYVADDTVSANIIFKNGVVFNGVWSFGLSEIDEKDTCEIIGTNGKISFSVFDGHTITVTINTKIVVLTFDVLQHVQQPMLEKVVAYFLGLAENPCSGDDGAVIMDWIDIITKK